MKTYPVTIRLTPEQVRKIRVVAALHNLTISEFMRGVIDRELDKAGVNLEKLEAQHATAN